MLVLSRHRDEKIMIGDDVVITIVDIRGDKVRLGIEAPGNVAVHRQEVYEAIQRANERMPSDAAQLRGGGGTCELCGEPMPRGEEMFRFHGHSGPCPKPPHAS